MGVVTSLFAHKMVAAAGPAVDARAALASVGLDPDAPADPSVMLRDTAYYALIERLAAQTDATALPLRAGASMRCDEYGALGLAWKAAPTLSGSLARVERYARLWTSVAAYEVRPHPAGALFVLHRDGPRRLGLRLSNEATLASAVSIARQVSPAPFAPLEVRLRHGAPERRDAHEAYFGCPLIFDADLDALLISAEALARRNRLGDEGITRYLLGHLDAELSRIAQAPGTGQALETRSREAIARALSDGPPRMAKIADTLGLSQRSYHRRLAETGLSFQKLADDTRRDLARGLLRESEHSLAEVAFLTGFSEQSAFTRAFKRWEGCTPARFRSDPARP